MEKSFIHKGVRRQSFLRATLACIGITVFAGMAGLTLVAQREKGIALDRKDELNRLYANLVWELVNEPFLDAQTPNATIGKVVVTDEAKFTAEAFANAEAEMSNESSVSGRPNPVLIGRIANGGNAIAVAHDGLVSKDNRSSLFLQNALLWLVDGRDNSLEPIKISFSTGHCEVVSATANPDSLNTNLPLDDIERWGYTIAPINDLTLADKLISSQVLIVGNAWASFTQAEIDAVEQFTNSGGALLLAGLGWSWSGYKNDSEGFNPCTWAMDSSNRSVDTDRYPMNELGARFGLNWPDSAY